MAYVRSKKTPKGKVYYQLVRTYREPGKVRQKVLAHLGPHDTLEGAIEHNKREEAACRAEAAAWRAEAESRKKYLLANYGDELGNSIPDYSEVYDTWRKLERDLHREYWRHGEMDQDVRLQRIKRLSHRWELYERILYYHEALGRARSSSWKEHEYREKLNELIAVQRTYY